MEKILIIHNDNRFEVRKKLFNNERHPTTNIGGKADLGMDLPF